MAGFEEEVALLREDVAAAQRDQAAAQHALDQATARQGSAAEALAEEFGVTPGKQAQQLERRLEAEAARQAALVRGELDKAGDPA